MRTRTATVVALTVLSVYVLASWEVRPLFFSNQNTYFLQGLRLAGVPGLQHDWLSQTRAPHIAFTLLVAGLQRLAVLGAGVQFVELLLQLCLIWTFWTLSGAGDDGSSETGVRFAICAVFFALLTERGWWHVLFHWGGLADQYVFAGYLQPSEFGVLILVAFALLTSNRNRLAIGCLVVATLFHVSYLLSCGVLCLAIAADRWLASQKREAVVLLALFGAGVAPAVLYGLSFGGDPATVTNAQALLARQIIPQHAWPARWFTFDQLIAVVVMTIGVAMAWRRWPRVVALAMTGSWLLMVAGTAYVYVSENTYVGLLFPWRASVYLYPLSLFFVLMAVTSFVRRVTISIAAVRANQIFNWGAVLCAVALLVQSGRDVTIQRPQVTFPFAGDVIRQTSATDEIIIPTGDVDLWHRFRLLTMRPTYVDDKSHPFLASEVLEWKRRVDAVNSLYRLPPDARPQRCRAMGADFYVEAAADEAVKPTLVSCGPSHRQPTNSR